MSTIVDLFQFNSLALIAYGDSARVIRSKAPSCLWYETVGLDDHEAVIVERENQEMPLVRLLIDLRHQVRVRNSEFTRPRHINCRCKPTTPDPSEEAAPPE